MKTILLDCDDVLLDWISGFRKFAASKLAYDIEGEPGSWDMSSWLGISKDLTGWLINEFNSSPDFGRLGPVGGAKRVIQQMHDDPDVRLHVISSCSSASNVAALRRANLIEEFGDVFDSIHCLDLGQSKLPILRAFQPGAMFIEDSYKNALMGLEAGHMSCIRERPHNRKFKQLTDLRLHWFADWSEMGKI